MLKYKVSLFDDLAPNELYQILRLRSEVFVVEQNCIFLDADNIDLECHHIMGFNKSNSIVACTRIVPTDLVYKGYSSIGRVVIHPSARASHEGYKLMKISIEQCKKIYPNTPIKIGAQAHLEKFYIKTGFFPTGQNYIEDDIPHTYMVMN
jgi:ElaA protein